MTTARQVLDTHLDLIDRYRHPPAELTYANRAFGIPDDLMLRTLGTARTYQVTEPMQYLAERLRTRQDNPMLGGLDPAELPWDNGFLWLDKPLEIEIEGFNTREVTAGGFPYFLQRVDDDTPKPVQIKALSWMKTTAYMTESGTSVPREADRDDLWRMPPEVRVAYAPRNGRKVWQNASWVMYWEDPPDNHHRDVYGPLFPCGWVVFPGMRAREDESDQQCVSLLRALWALMDMELAQSDRPLIERHVKKRAARLNVVPDIRVIKLRRTRAEGETTGEQHHGVDWSCQWLVRPHRRHYQNGTSTWIHAYIKGPDNKPLRLNDVADMVLYQLAR